MRYISRRRRREDHHFVTVVLATGFSTFLAGILLAVIIINGVNLLPHGRTITITTGSAR
jgi:hypothetical protein